MTAPPDHARSWLPSASHSSGSRRSASAIADLTGADTAALVETLIERNRRIHEVECVNLNPATNIMNPRAEAALAAGLGSRPSLGYAGAKYEMGLEAIEEIEVIAADLACRVFGARFAEIRVGSGALANLYAFMATCSAGDSIIVPPATIGGHITHRPERRRRVCTASTSTNVRSTPGASPSISTRSPTWPNACDRS